MWGQADTASWSQFRGSTVAHETRGWYLKGSSADFAALKPNSEGSKERRPAGIPNPNPIRLAAAVRGHPPDQSHSCQVWRRFPRRLRPSHQADRSTVGRGRHSVNKPAWLGRSALWSVSILSRPSCEIEGASGSGADGVPELELVGVELG